MGENRSAMPVGLRKDSPLTVRLRRPLGFPQTPTERCAVFHAETLRFFSAKHCAAVPASQLCPFSCRGTARGRPFCFFFFFFTRNRKLPSGNNPLAPVVFHAKLKLFTKRESAAAPQPFPDPFTKVLGGEGVGFWGGSLSSERFPLPSPSSQNIKNSRIKPVALVGGEGLKTDFEVAGIDRSAVHGFDFTDGEFPLVP